MEFAAMLRIKNEEQWIEEVIASTLGLCDQVFILDDNSTDRTVEICTRFGERVKIYRTPFEGFDESRDKNWLLDQIIDADELPDWILAIDGDEVLEKTGPQKIRQLVEQKPEAAVIRLRVCYLWNYKNMFRTDGVYGNFTRPSIFRLKDQPLRKLRYKTTTANGNLHCSNHPMGLQGAELTAFHIKLKHYGYMEREHRMKKYLWYNTIDPNNESEDCYRHLAELPGARYAGEKLALENWVE